MPRVNLDGLSPFQVEEIAAHADHLRRHSVSKGCDPTAGQSIAGMNSAGGEGNCLTVSDRQTRPIVEEVTLENVDDVMRYQPWMPDQLAAGDQVREALTAAVRAVLRNVPRCPSRTKAINHLIDARMDANAAISFRGRF